MQTGLAAPPPTRGRERRALIRLGLRLATGSATQERFRPVTVLLAGLISALVLLHGFAAANASAALNALPTLAISALSSLRWMVLLGIGLPVLGLLATATRLAAHTRDRRLSRLQVLGLTQRQTLLVAIFETGALLAAGLLLGSGLYLLTQPVAANLWHAAAEFPRESYRAGWVGWLVTLAGGLLLALLTAAVQVPSTAVAWRGDRIGRRPRRTWRLVVLGLGIAALLFVLREAHLGYISRFGTTAYVVGAALTATGVLLTAPVATTLVGRLLLVVSRRPATRIAARRLQHLPASSTRIAGSIVVALFVLALVQPLTDGLNSDPVAREDHRAATTGPHLLNITLPRYDDLPAAERILRGQGVTRIEMATYANSPDCNDQTCVMAVVGTCWSLTVDLLVPDCAEAPTWLGPPMVPVGEPVRLVPNRGGDSELVVTSPGSAMAVSMRPTSLEQELPSLFIPASDRAAARWLKDQQVDLMVEAPGGLLVEQNVADALRAEIPGAYAVSTRALSNYVTNRNILTSLAAVRWAILALGLLSFLMASADQVLGRRESMRSLVLLGAPRSTLQRAQLIESLTPLLISVPAAIGLGHLAGSTYLKLGGGDANWNSVVLAMTVAAAGTAVVAATLLVLAVPRITPTGVRRV